MFDAGQTGILRVVLICDCKRLYRVDSRVRMNETCAYIRDS